MGQQRNDDYDDHERWGGKREEKRKRQEGRQAGRQERWASPPLEVGLLQPRPTKHQKSSPVREVSSVEMRRGEAKQSKAACVPGALCSTTLYYATATTRTAVTNQLWRPSPINRPPPFLYIFTHFLLLLLSLYFCCTIGVPPPPHPPPPPPFRTLHALLAALSLYLSLTRTHARTRKHTHSLTTITMITKCCSSNTRRDTKHKLRSFI
jgi:hypothetical protein